MTTTLSTIIILRPNQLQQDLEKILLNYLHSKFDKSSSKEIGYISSVSKIISYDNVISRNGESIVFSVKFSANCVEPKKDQDVIAKIIGIYSYGIFLEKDNMEIILPYHGKDEKNFKRREDSFLVRGKLVKIGDDLRVSIKDFRYDKDKIGCIAGL